MNTRTSKSVLTALVVLLAAGVAASAQAQVASKSTRESTRESTTVASTVDFRSARWMSDRSVVNNNGEDIANVSDLILDRGSGRIEYVVIKTGTTFGLGGRAVAIPYSSFRWELGGKDRFVLASTPEQLKQFAEYTPESWKAMKASQKDSKNMLHERLALDAAAATDPYAGSLDTAKKSRVEGEIRTVERVRTSKFGEQVVITVDTGEGVSRKITVGPSWYVNGTAAAPMRGDKVVVDTLALARDPDQLLVATKLRSGEHEIYLRDDKGSAAWALKSIESGGQSYSTPYTRYLLLSTLPGTKIDARGSECGKVHDILLDRTSGEIAFLSIDPNQNFLGISDTKRLLPWSVATVTLDGTVRIDASKEMILASPETPSEPSTLNSGTHAERVYKAFNVPAPRFEVRKPTSATGSETDAAWSNRGTILAAIERDSAKTLEGKVVDTSDVTFENGVHSARAVKLKMSGENGTEETILLGPAWYMENQKLGYVNGDSVTIDAVRTSIDGHRYWIAKAVDCKGKRVVLLDGSNAPSWARP